MFHVKHRKEGLVVARYTKNNRGSATLHNNRVTSYKFNIFNTYNYII